MSGRVLVVIPARLGSTRLAKKPLLRETGKYLIQHVYERALEIAKADEVVVATDHESIVDAVRGFGGAVEMTSPDHRSGSDRVAEVVRRREADIVVNLQGDEPEFDPAHVDALIAAIRAGGVDMATLHHNRVAGPSEQDNPSVVKLVRDEHAHAVDFRREPTPGGFPHVGIYAYTQAALARFCELPQSRREQERRLEQMRALDNGMVIAAVGTPTGSIGIDTPEDYAAFVSRVNTSGD
ncbi:MAG: 3-deoxy-manno-octulosonate cytidylyltransferase [Planctomycetota bacterium]|nr:3-deoxy-manno-octulosonate cytidylyltransferase [Planctomycetota bacterium]